GVDHSELAKSRRGPARLGDRSAAIEIGSPPETESRSRQDLRGLAGTDEVNRRQPDRLRLHRQMRERIVQDDPSRLCAAAEIGDVILARREDGSQRILELSPPDRGPEAVHEDRLSSNDVKKMAPGPWRQHSALTTPLNRQRGPSEWLGLGRKI